MHHQREKYYLGSLLSLGIAILVGSVAIFKSSYFFMIFCFYLLAISIISDALLLNMMFRKPEGLMQLIRGVVLIILVTFLFLKLI